MSPIVCSLEAIVSLPVDPLIAVVSCCDSHSSYTIGNRSKPSAPGPFSSTAICKEMWFSPWSTGKKSIKKNKPKPFLIFCAILNMGYPKYRRMFERIESFIKPTETE